MFNINSINIWATTFEQAMIENPSMILNSSTRIFPPTSKYFEESWQWILEQYLPAFKLDIKKRQENDESNILPVLFSFFAKCNKNSSILHCFENFQKFSGPQASVLPADVGLSASNLHSNKYRKGSR